MPSGSKGVVGGTIDRYRTYVKPDGTDEQRKIDYAKCSTLGRSAKTAFGTAFALPNELQRRPSARPAAPRQTKSQEASTKQRERGRLGHWPDSGEGEGVGA